MSHNQKYKNRLIEEKSPYLLQHAHNPVDWYPWGDEAFEKARKEDKPVFLSIGYSTCHWCHVMERESFENEEVAKIINQYFIPIKVDREERPDIDHAYMTAVTAITGQGGWPLTVFLTPDKKPFFGGTYFPPYAKWGSSGLVEIIESIHHSWMNNRDQLNATGESLTEMLRERASMKNEKGQLSKDVFEKSYAQFYQNYDTKFGGFGHSPKFPSSHNLSFLLRYWKRHKDSQGLVMVEHTLHQMAQGGIHDHLGGGFHRYSTDQEWQVPHFEKMLYDQAILARAYLEAYQITKNEFYAQTAREIFDYVLRDMQNRDGGFYSAEDADSFDPDEYSSIQKGWHGSLEKKEGAFFLWRYEEILNILGKDEALIFNYHYGIQIDGNARYDPHGEFTGKNIIFAEHTLEESAKYFHKSIEGIKEVLNRFKEQLFSARLKRPRPHLDDKILLDWNALMISSLAFGSQVLKNPRYQQAAERSAQFINKRMINPHNRLLHRYRDGQSAILGHLDDYAYFIGALLDLYESTFKLAYLRQAHDLALDMIELFWDQEQGGFYFTAKDSQDLLFRQKEIYDGAIPSGNSMAALGLIRLSHLTFQKIWDDKLVCLFQTFASEIMRIPSAYSQMLIAFDFACGPSQEIVITAPCQDEKFPNMLAETYHYFIPNRTISFRPSQDAALKAAVELSPFLQGQPSINNQPTVYICENHVCKLPLTGLPEFQKVLENLS